MECALTATIRCPHAQAAAVAEHGDASGLLNRERLELAECALAAEVLKDLQASCETY